MAGQWFHEFIGLLFSFKKGLTYHSHPIFSGRTRIIVGAPCSKANSIAPDFHDRNWDALIYAIYYQKCILLLGPDAAIEEVEGGEFRPCTDILANELAKDIGEELKKEDIDTNELLQSAQYYQWIMNNRMLLEEKVTSFYAKRENLTSPLHKNLASLPFSLIITSTFDNMILNALKELKQPRVDFHHYKGPKRELVEMGTVDSPLIYQFYGSLKDPRSLVITENDLLDLLVKVASKDAPLPANILCELISEDKSLLFLGFGFRYWYLRVLLHLINIGTRSSCSFALEKIEPTTIEEIRRTTMFIENKHLNIKICNAELTDFVEKLICKYKEKYGTTRSNLTKPPDPFEKPSVFISYVRENENTVSTLQKKLKEAQIDVRIDRDILDPGVKWGPKIVEFIWEVDYFIFLLSQDLVQQRETFAYQELEEALKRQCRFRGDLTFIIPVKMDDCGIPQNLQNLHVETVDLRGGAGVEKIVQAIKRDFQRRKAQGYAA